MSKILFLGDFFYDYDYFAEDIKKISKWINSNGIHVVLNLETSLVKTDKLIKKRGPHIYSSFITIDVLKSLNVCCVCLANNHFMDFGSEGAKESLRLLDENGIKHVGAGNNLESALKSCELIIDGKRIILNNFGWDVEETKYATKNDFGCAPLFRDEIVQSTSSLRKQFPDAFIVNLYHWGFEFNKLPMPLDIRFAHNSIDAGCDLIIGHHPHVIQPKENYKGKSIYYSLGNFYFGSMRKNYFRELCNDECDIGAGVLFDLNNNSLSEVEIYYDKDKDCSAIISSYELNDITGVDFSSEEYLKNVEKAAMKPNPILTLNEKENHKKLKTLAKKYWIARKLQFLKKTSFGNRFYNFLKRKAK